MQRRDLAQFFSWIRNVLDLFPRGVEGFLDTAVEDRMENVFLTLEVEVNSAVGYTRCAGDIGDLRVEVTIVCKDAYRGAQNGFTFVTDG